MAVNYEDPRFDQVEDDKNQAMTELEQVYSGMIGESNQFYQDQIDATKEWADKQSQLQQEQTDFTIQQIEQQKQQTQKDYIKEQSGAYVDWQKQSNQYGAAAEQQAQMGMTNTGFSESSQVSMYTAYQNRVATAREVVAQAFLNYDNGIKEAQLQNSSVLAEIQFQALDKQLKLALEGFQYENNLILELTNKKVEMDNEYYNRYLAVLDQINTENAMAEEQRQFDATYELQQKEFAEQIRQYNQNYQLQLKQFNEEVRQYNQSYNEQVRQFNEEIARLKKKDAQEYALQIKQLELQKKQLAEQKRQHDQEMAYKQAQLAEQKRQYEQEIALKKQQLAFEQAQAAKSSSGGTAKITTTKKSSGGSGSVNVSSAVSGLVAGGAYNPNNYQSAYKTISAMITAGYSKDQVLSEIAIAQKKGALTAAEAAKLRAVFNPKGQQYT